MHAILTLSTLVLSLSPAFASLTPLSRPNHHAIAERSFEPEEAPHVAIIDRALEEAGFTLDEVAKRGYEPAHVIHAARHLKVDVGSALSKRAPKLAAVLGGSGCKTSKKFALTFDDGVYDTSLALGRRIKAANGTGTFFVNGNNWRCTYNLGDKLQAQHKAGNMLGSHGWSHMDSATLTYEQMHLQLKLVEDMFSTILGFKPLYFRPPFGSYNDLTLQVVAERGYKGIVLWDFDSHDTAFPKLPSSEILAEYQKRINAYPKSTLALNHDVQEQTTKDIMPKVIPQIAAKGFKMVSVGECLGLGQDATKWYKTTTGKMGTRDSSWTCDSKPAPGKAA